MPITTKWEPKGFVFLVSGVVTFEEIHAANMAFFRNPRSDSATYQIVDLREAERLDTSQTEASTVGAYDYGQSRSTPGVRVAFVVSDDRFAEHIAAYDAVLADSSWRVGTFTDIVEARKWATDALESR